MKARGMGGDGKEGGEERIKEEGGREWMIVDSN
jgi:hypothetical protein